MLATGYGAAGATGIGDAPFVEKPFTRERLKRALTTELAMAAPPKTA